MINLESFNQYLEDELIKYLPMYDSTIISFRSTSVHVWFVENHCCWQYISHRLKFANDVCGIEITDTMTEEDLFDVIVSNCIDAHENIETELIATLNDMYQYKMFS